VNDRCKGLMVLADPLIDKVFYNLFNNTARHSGGAATAEVLCEADGGELVIAWQDDGQGVSAEDKENIFERGAGRNSGL